MYYKFKEVSRYELGIIRIEMKVVFELTFQLPESVNKTDAFYNSRRIRNFLLLLSV